MEVITTHVNADFDAMGSMIAAKKLYPEAILVFPGSQERTLREYFIKSTVYIYGFKRLRDIDIEEVTRLILVDTRQSSRIGKFAEILDKPDMQVHVYDHHPEAEDDIKAHFSIVKPFGSTVTLLTQLLRERNIEVSPEEATIMSLGVFEDTGSFTFNNTTPEDFEAAAFLLKSGADLNVVSDMVTQELTAEQINLLNEMILSAKNYTLQGVDVCITTVSIDKYVGDFAVLVHKLRDIENLNVIFALARMDDRVYLVARSRIPEVNVSAVASYFGGGGHATAASASIKDLTLVQAEAKLLDLLRSHIHPYPTAENLMTSPAITTEPGLEIGEAELTMVRYNINAMPVVQDGVLVGLITRQVLEKALFHGLTHQTVAEFMNSDVAIVSPIATLIEIQTHLVERHQRILPVVENGKILGVITRRDLLDFMLSDHVDSGVLYEEASLSHWSKRKNIQSVLSEQLPKNIIQMLKEFGAHAQSIGFRAYAVGGFVRDLLLRRPNFDIDIVVEGDAIEFAKAFAEEHRIRCKFHRKFNTAMLIFPDGQRVDVASARFEYYQHPAALPIVEFSSLKMDLYRRDFTINVLAIALNPDEFGQLIDFFSGQRDIKEKVIRVLHNLSFVEDPTRILRAIRFEQRFGFKIGKQSAALIRNAVRMDLIQKLGGHRFFHEVQLVLEEDDPVPALRRMAEFAVMPVLAPGMNFDKKMEIVFARLREVISWYRLSFPDESLDRWWVYLLALFSELGREDVHAAANRLLLTVNQRERMLWTHENVTRLLWSFFQVPDRKPNEIYRALQPFRPEELLFLMGKAEKEATRRAVSHFFLRYRNVQTEVKGRDLKDLGIPPGKIYRLLLDELLDARLNGEVRSRNEEFQYLIEKHPELFSEPGEMTECTIHCEPTGVS
ncbi:MAG: CBS domain-containing protein [Syntrophobacteraceae bacterium]